MTDEQEKQIVTDALFGAARDWADEQTKQIKGPAIFAFLGTEPASQIGERIYKWLVDNGYSVQKMTLEQVKRRMSNATIPVSRLRLGHNRIGAKESQNDVALPRIRQSTNSRS